MLIDTHCHLDSKKFDGDRAGILQRARARGVQRFITIGCDVENSRRAQTLALVHNDVFFSAGVHPHEAEHVNRDFIMHLRGIALHGKCVAIGECGLDYYYDHSPREKQQEVFREQLIFAAEVEKPVVVHVRDAWEDCLRLLAEHPLPAGGVIHCFSGTLANAEAALALGYYLSIPGIVTFSKAGDLPDVVKMAPRNRLLVETDSPYLAPKPHRGKRNEPSFVADVAQKVAELRDVSVKEIHQLTGENAQRLFGLQN
ncbi:MAG: TatD family hydrolase [Deltaproteobacteria bacterium]|nr:TatD family hydrolase [Deltaproteobacteria bacterium]